VVAFIVFVERRSGAFPSRARAHRRPPHDGRPVQPSALKVNSGGVMPVIFASSILSAAMLFSQVEWVQNSRFLQPIIQRWRRLPVV